MALPTITDDSTAEELLQGLNSYLDAAQAHLVRGEMAELAGLDSLVDALCGRVKAMTLDEGRRYAEPLDGLFLRLDRLQKDMGKLQAQMKKEVQELTARSKAMKAYGKETS